MASEWDPLYCNKRTIIEAITHANLTLFLPDNKITWRAFVIQDDFGLPCNSIHDFMFQYHLRQVLYERLSLCFHSLYLGCYTKKGYFDDGDPRYVHSGRCKDNLDLPMLSSLLNVQFHSDRISRFENTMIITICTQIFEPWIYVLINVV